MNPRSSFSQITKNALSILIVCVASIAAQRGIAGDRIWLKDAEINSKPTKLIFDSGSPCNFVSPEALKRLGLRFIPAATNELALGLWAGDTELCNASFNGIRTKTTFVVLDLPGYVDLDLDGGIGWCTLRSNALRIDAISQTVTLLRRVPRNALRWSQFSVSTNLETLELRVPHGKDPEGILWLDTGFDGGVSLPEAEWVKWRKANPQSTATLKTTFSPTDGFEIKFEAWAERISFGPLALTDVPIEKEGPNAASRRGTNYEGRIGLAALKRMELIVDARKGTAYLSTRTTPPPPYAHNRLGAVFAPTATHTNQAVAFVLDGGPAYEAGVRNGDVLLQLDEIPCTSWSENWLSRFQRPAGTKLHLTLERDGKTFKLTAILRDILHPSAIGK